jgi:hypothetical protein
VEASLQHSREVAWTAAATADIEQHAAVLKLYSGAASDAVDAITQALQVDVRSSYMTDKVSYLIYFAKYTTVQLSTSTALSSM